MDDFLRDSQEAKTNRLGVDIEIGHEILANASRKATFPAKTWEGIGTYSPSQLFFISHGLFHLACDGSPESLKCAMEWIKDFDQLLRLVWVRQYQYQTLLGDLGLFMQIVGGNDRTFAKYTLDILVLAEHALTHDPRE